MSEPNISLQCCSHVPFISINTSGKDLGLWNQNIMNSPLSLLPIEYGVDQMSCQDWGPQQAEHGVSSLVHLLIQRLCQCAPCGYLNGGKRHMEQAGRVRRKGSHGAICLHTQHFVHVKDAGVSCGSIRYTEWSWRAILPSKRAGLQASDCATEVSREGITEVCKRSG